MIADPQTPSSALLERAALCAALGLAPADARARALRAPLDWERLAERAQEAMALPSLATAIPDGSDFASGQLRASLNDALLHNTVQNRLLVHDLASTAKLLDALGIASIAIKGASLLARHPERVKLRHTDDIDLWVEPDREDKAFDALLSAGYVLLDHTEPPVTPRYDGSPQIVPEDRHQLPALVSPRGTPIELHRFLPGTEGVTWKRARADSEPMTIDGTDVWLRTDAATMGDLCSHVVLHHMAMPSLWPRHLMDLAALIRARPGVVDLALAGRTLLDRLAILVSLTVLHEAERSVEGGLLARRLVFPGGAPLGWGLYRAMHQIVTQLRVDPGNLARVVWPSPGFLVSRGFLQPGDDEWRGRLNHFRSVLARALSAAP